MSVLLLNGPNLNLLGLREPELYGRDTLADVEARFIAEAAALGHAAACMQSNHEGVLIDRIHAARQDGTRGIVINPGGLTHTSVALRDALLGVSLPFVEIHISNIHTREPFRRHSFLSDVATAVVVGEGVAGYAHALHLLHQRLAN